MEPAELRAVIASAQAGRADGLAALLEAYGPRLFGYFLRATGSHHDAEDLLSEMALRLVRQIGKYDDRGRFEPWLFRIAANMIRDRIRRYKSHPTAMSLSIESDDGTRAADTLAGKWQKVDAGMMAAEASDGLAKALEQLDAGTREMVLLRYFGQMSFKELADTFECPLGTVLARVHRGLAALREMLEPPQ